MLLTNNDAVAKLKNLNTDWKIQDDSLILSVHLKDFSEAIKLAVLIAEPSNTLNHHPNLAIEWGKLGVSLTTHDAGGLTDKDFELATVIDELVDGFKNK